MHGGEGKVEGVGCRFRRDDSAGQEAVRERVGFRCVRKLWNARQHAEPFAREFGVAIGRFPHHDRRDEQVIFVAMIVPPILGGLLIGANPRQRAASGDKVAGNGCFEVEARLHDVS